jgi:two-component system, NtrC family, sensor kinase
VAVDIRIAKAVHKQPKVVPNSSQPNRRILIIDDNPSIHEDFKKVFAQSARNGGGLDEMEAALFGDDVGASMPETSFQLDSAFQGEEGLGRVQEALNAGRPYAMAFVDVRMPPGWDGIETVAHIWKVDPDLQVVICTAYSDYSWGEMIRKLGQSDRLVILKKPFDNIEATQLACSLTHKWELLQQSRLQMATLEEKVAARTAEIVEEQKRFQALFNNSPEGIYQMSQEGRFVNANPALAKLFGYESPQELMETVEEIPSQLFVDSESRRAVEKQLQENGILREIEAEVKCKDGTRKWISETACKILDQDGSLQCYQGFVLDITARKAAEKERSLMELHLRQAQKLESVGQLAAGIAHEINTPIQYIGDNIRFIKDAFTDLHQLISEYEKLETAARVGAVPPEFLSKLKDVVGEVDVPYLSAEVPKAIEQSLDGVNRVSKIICAMKEFSYPGTTEKTPTDLNHCIETTITVASNEWKYVADVLTDFAVDLPKVPCLQGEFNQVILNLIVNAAHAISDSVKQGRFARGTIKVSTRKEDSWSVISIADNGMGIPEEVKGKMFEPFFTTKPVGKGTGQGLAISRSIIVNKHGGQLTFESLPGQGTTFIVKLPIAGQSQMDKGRHE